MRFNTRTVLAVLLSASMVFSSMVNPPVTISAMENVMQIADDNLYGSYTTNIALNKNGYSSSNERQDKNYPVKVGYLTNGSATGTNYIITHRDDANPWFCVDLGSVQDINKVVVNQGAESSSYPNAYATSYVIEYSNYTGELGGTTTDENAAYIESDIIWTKVAEVNDAKLGTNTTVFNPINTRYIRVRATQKYDTLVSLYEMYVYGTDYSKNYDDTQATDGTRILFIGNSLTEYNNVAAKVEDIFAHEGVQIEWDKLIQLGKTLEYHYSLPETGQTILNGNYDYIVLQDKASGFNGDTLMSGATKLYDSFISKTDAKIVMYSPWANESVLKSTQAYFTDSYMKVATKYNAPIAPAGEAWFDLYYNYGYSWYSDNIHASNVGSFISASSIYYAISGVTNPVKYKSSDMVVGTNGNDVNIVNLISERTCYYTTLANKDTSSYVSIARNFVESETTKETPTEEVTTLVPEGEKVTGTTVDASVFGSSANIAKGKPVYASSEKQGAKNAVDGNTQSRWESDFADPQWIYVDLEKNYNISKVALMWEGAYAKKYHIQVSIDAVNWTTVKTVTASEVNTVEIPMNNVSCRYIRMFGETRGTQYGYSIYEFGVWTNNVEETTTQPQTTAPQETTTQTDSNPYYDGEGQVKNNEILDIEGFQIKTTYDETGNASPGFRVIERVGQSSVGGHQVVENGILLVREDMYNRNLMTTDEGDLNGTDLNEKKLNENNVLVAVATADPIEWSNSAYDDTDAYYNAFTMINNIDANDVVKSLSNVYYVRAFAKLSNGQIIYSKIYKSSIYSAADALYKNKQMSNNTAHEYLYNEILSVVTQNYAKVDYSWSNILHKPEAE